MGRRFWLVAFVLGLILGIALAQALPFTSKPNAYLPTPNYYMPNIVWQAHFENGTFQEYNGGVHLGCGSGLVLVPSPYVHHTIVPDELSGAHSEFDYYDGPPQASLNSSLPCRAYSGVDLAVPPYSQSDLTDFEISVTIKVPSSVNSESVNLTGWLSFITAGTGKQTNGWTVDSADRDLHLWVRCMDVIDGSCHSGVQPDISGYKWQFDKPFTIHAYYFARSIVRHRIVITVSDSTGTYLIANYVGSLGSQEPVRYQYFHFGLYIGPTQGTIGWYEDDIEISTPYF